MRCIEFAPCAVKAQMLKEMHEKDKPKQTSFFEGLVERKPEYYETEGGKRFLLIHVKGFNKPLAISADQKIRYMPSEGDHISAMDVTEGRDWWFCGHRAVMVLPNKIVWKPSQKMTADERQRAYAIVLVFARGHPGGPEEQGTKCSMCGELIGRDVGRVSPNDVRDSLGEIFEGRDPHINGAVFSGLKKSNYIHPFSREPTTDESGHASTVDVYHLTREGKMKADTLL